MPAKMLNQCLKFQRNRSQIRSMALRATNASAKTDPAANALQISYHDKLIRRWWDPNGPAKSLHAFDAIRVPFITDQLWTTYFPSPEASKEAGSLKGLKILEVGCGPGILTENLARYDAQVVGIDASDGVIQMAEQHVEEASPQLRNRISYKCDTIENHSEAYPNYYDAVVVSQVIVRVENLPLFITKAVKTIKPGGSIFITAPNRTKPMLIVGIYYYEYLAGVIPPGTHDWNKFVTPQEAKDLLQNLNCSTKTVKGFEYKSRSNVFKWSSLPTYFYALHAMKQKTEGFTATE